MTWQKRLIEIFQAHWTSKLIGLGFNFETPDFQVPNFEGRCCDISVHICVHACLAMLQSMHMHFDWCGFYYFVRNSLVALLAALCARIFFFRFVNICFSWHLFFVCARSLTKPFFRPYQPGSCAWLSPFLLCADCTLYMCACVCVHLYVHVKMCR